MSHQLIVALHLLRVQLAGINAAHWAGVEQCGPFTLNDHRLQVADGQSNTPVRIHARSTLDAIQDQLIACACHLLAADSGAIYWLSEPDGLLRLHAPHDLPAEDIIVRIPPGWDPIDRAVTQRRPISARFEPPLASEARSRPGGPDLGAAWAALAQRYGAVLVIPLMTLADVFGTLVLFQHTAFPVTTTDMEMAQAVGGYVAGAIENAWVVEAVQHQARMDERQRLARDLHDSVTQALYVVNLYAEAAIRCVAAGNAGTATSYLHEVRSTAQAALQELRLLIFELHPPILEQGGLVPALQARLDAVEDRTGLERDFSVIGEHRPTLVVEQALYRVTQEALNNVLKHAQARRVSVVLQQHPERTMLTIADDGIGFDSAAATMHSGFGLRGMDERVAQVGGRLTVESRLGQGTVVRVEVGI